MEVLACPSRSAAAREDRPAWSMRVATVLRKTWEVTQSKPAAAKASRRSAWVLDGSRQPPSGAGNTGRALLLATVVCCRRARPPQHVDAPAGEDQGAAAGVGLGRLDRQPFAAHTDGGGFH